MLIALIFSLGCKKQIAENRAVTTVKAPDFALNNVTKAAFKSPEFISGTTGGGKWSKVNYDLASNKTTSDSVLLSFDGALSKEIHANCGSTLGYMDITDSSLIDISLKIFLQLRYNLLRQLQKVRKTMQKTGTPTATVSNRAYACKRPLHSIV